MAPIIVNPSRIELYSQCPKKFHYGYREVAREPASLTLPTDIKIVAEVIKDLYVYISRKGQVPTWQSFIRRTENYYKKFYRQGSVILSEDISHITKLITTIQKWYRDTFPNYTDVAYVNFPIEMSLDGRVTYEDFIDIITIGQEVRLFSFSETNNTVKELYNNLLVQVRLWGFAKYADKIPKEFVCYAVDKSNVIATSFYPMTTAIHKTETFVRQILEGVRSNVWYPSYGQQCLSCKYRETCSY